MKLIWSRFVFSLICSLTSLKQELYSSNAFVVASSLSSPVSFATRVSVRVPSSVVATRLQAEAGGNNDADKGPPPSSSNLEGNQREPSVQEMSVMDEMIDRLVANVDNPVELSKAVQSAFLVCSSPRFFLRLAERADQQEDDVQKERFVELANQLSLLVQTLRSSTERLLDDCALDVERVVKSCAEPDSGEFLVPLLPERIQNLRTTLQELPSHTLTSEGFLSTIDAWTNKSHQDGMDGMVVILQTVLQQCAGISILRARQAQRGGGGSNDNNASSQLFDRLLSIDTDKWNEEIIRAATGQNPIETGAILGQIQSTMENVVLGLEAGSMAQRLQAEYLKELVLRIETIQQALDKSNNK